MTNPPVADKTEIPGVGLIQILFNASFRSLDIDPPEAERFICNLVLVIWDLTTK